MNDKYPTKKEREHEETMAICELPRHNFMLAMEVGILKRKLRGEKTEYSYWNGTEMITADPLKLYGDLTGISGEFDLAFYIDWMVSQSPSCDAGKSAIPVVEKARKVFNLTGLTHDDVMNLVLHFYEFCGVLKVQ